MTCDAIVANLRSQANADNVAGMARYGINTEATLGVPVPALRKLARQVERNHELAGQLWATGIHEARILACLIDEPDKVTAGQMDRWVRDFDSWDICDLVCSNLFDRTPRAYTKAKQWAGRKAEFAKRAGFAMMAALAVHDKSADDDTFAAFLPLIEREATDERNFVKKAVNWALRNIGKRNVALHKLAIESAERIAHIDSRAARWIASNALRELRSQKILTRLQISPAS